MTEKTPLTMRAITGLAALWLGRVAAVILFILWGVFFIEHTQQWLFNPEGFPSIGVILFHSLHLFMIIGLAVSIRWQLIGSLIFLPAAAAFFYRAAGENFIPFFGVTSIPAVLYYIYWVLFARSQKTGVEKDTNSKNE